MRKGFVKRTSVKGFPVDNFDSRTGVECPRPQCNKIVVYNGNYFCECGWAAPDLNFNKMEQDEKDYMEALYTGLMEGRNA